GDRHVDTSQLWPPVHVMALDVEPGCRLYRRGDLALGAAEPTAQQQGRLATVERAPRDVAKEVLRHWVLAAQLFHSRIRCVEQAVETLNRTIRRAHHEEGMRGSVQP